MSIARTVPWLAVLLAAIAVAVFFPTRYLSDSLDALARSSVGLATTYADQPAVFHAAFYLHIVFSGIALLIGGFQFSGRLRRHAPAVHRWIGRTYVVAVVIGGLAGFVMSFVNSLAFNGFFGFGALALLWIWTTYRGYTGARSRDFAAHQAWMIRSFALTYAAVTLRLWLIGLTLLQIPFGVDEATADVNAYAPVPFLCWLPNLVVAEYLIHKRRLPSLIQVPNLTGRTAVSSTGS